MSKFLKKRTLICISALAVFGATNCTLKSKHDPPNTLHMSVEAKVKGLDPIFADDLYSGIQSSQAYETLLQYHYLKRPYVLVPALAESLPEISADHLTYTFQLKKGVLFQDDPCFKATGGKGREMTAEDVAYSFKRLADPKNGSTGWWTLDGKLVGLNAWRDEIAKSGIADYSKPVEGLKVIDRYTLQFKLTQPSSQFIFSLAMPFTGIVPQEAVAFYGKEFLNHPVGTGPFRLAEFNPNSRIVWQKNPTYRLEAYPTEGMPGDREAGLLDDAGKPLPLAEKVVVQVFLERQPLWLNFLSGKIDLSAIPKDNYSSAITSTRELSDDLKRKGIQLVKVPTLDVTHMSFNLTDPLIGKNKLLRQAISLAYDEDSFIDLFYNGRAVPAQGPIPPGISGYDQSFRNPYRQFNILKAKELLAKAGFPDGKGLPPLEFATLADSTNRQASEYFEKTMSAIGVKIKVSTYSWPQFQEIVRNKKAQIWDQAWSADYPDAENFLQLFYSKNVSPGPNDANYVNSQFDQLYERSLQLSDGPQRTELYQKMVNILVEDCPWIFGSHRLSYVVSHPWLKNYKPNDFDHARYKYYRVETVKK